MKKVLQTLLRRSRAFWDGDSRFRSGLRRFVAPAEIDPTTVIGPGAKVENFAGETDRINIGAHSFIRGRLLTYGHGGRIRIGQWCYIGDRTEIWSMDSIEIGDRVLIAHDVNIHDGDAHSRDLVERHDHFRHIIEKGHPSKIRDLPGISSAPVVIEDDVWISFGVTILKGVRIGSGSIVAAGSVVTRDVPPNVIFRCKVEPIIEALPG
jgi:acetyltransferase-like isoleucine patch superfamily enzyme